MGSNAESRQSAESGAIADINVSTTNDITGTPMPTSLGVVRGITVRSRNVARNIGAGLKAGFIGGEITSWTSLCEVARNEAPFQFIFGSSSSQLRDGHFCQFCF